MRYENMVPGVFIKRPNRFIAHIEIGGTEEVCHVKNTGRCRELLPEGAEVFCQRASNPDRKIYYIALFSLINFIFLIILTAFSFLLKLL